MFTERFTNTNMSKCVLIHILILILLITGWGEGWGDKLIIFTDIKSSLWVGFKCIDKTRVAKIVSIFNLIKSFAFKLPILLVTCVFWKFFSNLIITLVFSLYTILTWLPSFSRSFSIKGSVRENERGTGFRWKIFDGDCYLSYFYLLRL